MKYTLIFIVSIFSCNKINTKTPTTTQKKPSYNTSKTIVFDDCVFHKVISNTRTMYIHDKKVCNNPIHRENYTHL